MMVVITYDVNTSSSEGQKRLRKVAKACERHGSRVQNSVFECLLDPAQFKMLKSTLESIISPERDSLRFYFMGDHYASKIEHIGVRRSYDPQQPLLM